MSQSKISVTDNAEKKFVIKHVFKDVINMKENETVDGPVEYHYGIPWKIRILREGKNFIILLDCLVSTDYADWSLCIRTSGKLIRDADEIPYIYCNFAYQKGHSFYRYNNHSCSDHQIFTDGRNVSYEFTVLIEKVVGVDLVDTKKLRNFDDESAKEDSDVTLIVQDQKFHVSKVYLAAQSPYFKSLFSGNFAESEKSEIELKDMDPNDFQYFLEFLYAESYIEGYSVLGILHLADFFDAKTAIRRCQEFLVKKSELSLKQKFDAAIKYNLEELKTKCISEMKSAADLKSIIPENGVKYDHDVWMELFEKAVFMLSK